MSEPEQEKPDVESTPENENVGGDAPPRPIHRRIGSALTAIPKRCFRIITSSTKLTIIFGAVVILLTSAALAGWVISSEGEKFEAQALLDLSQEAYDEGKFADARTYAMKVLEQGVFTADQKAQADYLLGVASVGDARNVWGDSDKPFYTMAARYLEEAYMDGFPEGKEAEGLLLLGKSLYHSGHYEDAIRYLLEALPLNPNSEADIRKMLANSYLSQRKPDLSKALDENSSYLKIENLSMTARAEGLLQKATILLELKQYEECLKTLEEISPNATCRPDAEVVRGQIYYNQAEAIKHKENASPEDLKRAETLYDKAIDTFNQIQANHAVAIKANIKALYLIGLCLIGKGDYRAALHQFEKTVSISSGTPEVVASLLRSMELEVDLKQYKAAMKLFNQLITALPPVEEYNNHWVPLAELQKRLLEVFHKLINDEQYELALEMSDRLDRVMTHTQILGLIAETHSEWLESLHSEARHASPQKAERIREKILSEYRDTGMLYRRLARAQILTKSYTDDIWQSGVFFFKGHDYLSAIEMFNLYLREEARSRHPQAMVYLAESLLAVGRIDEALRMVKDCITFFPSDTSTYQARLLAAKAYVEKNDFEQAEKVLLENILGDRLTPSSIEWRDSLFDLGLLYFSQKKYDKAILRLEEAMIRYPDAPQALDARYALGDSYLQEGLAAQGDLRESLGGVGRNINTRRTRELFESARREFELIRKGLTTKMENQELTALDNAMLRNTYFAMGDIAFAENNFDESIQAYSAVTNRYQNQPEVLLAYVRMADAYRRLDKPHQARLMLEQAKIVLGRLSEDADFSKTTNYNREQWTELLDLLINNARAVPERRN